MEFISVRLVPRGCVLQHIKCGVLGTNTNTKAGSQVRASPEKWGRGGGVLGTGKTRERGINKWYLKERVLVTDVEQKGVIGSLFINYLYFYHKIREF